MFGKIKDPDQFFNALIYAPLALGLSLGFMFSALITNNFEPLLFALFTVLFFGYQTYRLDNAEMQCDECAQDTNQK